MDKYHNTTIYINKNEVNDIILYNNDKKKNNTSKR